MTGRSGTVLLVAALLLVSIIVLPAAVNGMTPTEACAHLERLRWFQYTIPGGDIATLLPLLRNYAYNAHTTIEFGTRFGSSTTALSSLPTKWHASGDLKISKIVRKLNSIAAKCHSEKNGYKRTPVEGNDLTIPMPFLSDYRNGDQTKSEQYIDMLFIDTLHSAKQLMQELVRLPKYVKTRITFHDATTFLHEDEGEPPSPGGLRSPIRDFLKNTKEWEEEVYFPHNSGLLVLRRVDSDATKAGQSAEVLMSSEEWIKADADFMSNFTFAKEVSTRPVVVQGGSYVERLDAHRDGCKAAMRAASCTRGCSMFCILYNHNFFFDSPLERFFSFKLMPANPKRLPVAPLLPVVFGYTASVYNRVVYPHKASPKTFVVVYGCVESVVVAATHAAAVLGMRVVVVAPNDECSIVTHFPGIARVSKTLESAEPEGTAAMPINAHLAVVAGRHQTVIKGVLAHGGHKLALVLGTADASVGGDAVQEYGWSVDSVVTAGLGYVVYRRNGYDGHRYSRDEPDTELPKQLYYHWTDPKNGESERHPSWKKYPLHATRID